MVNRADINSVLMQMRQVRQQVQPADVQAKIANAASVSNPTHTNPTFANQLNIEKSQMASQPQLTSQLSPQHQVRQEVTQSDLEQRAMAMSNQVNPTNNGNSVPEFREMFGNAINKVNNTQMNAGDLATRFTQGDPNIDLPEVMVALQKSSVSFQAMTQVRNKLLEAYKDIMNMPV